MNSKHVMGRPCKYGHSGLRYAASRCCVECQAQRNKLPHVKKQMLAANKRRYGEIREKTLAKGKEYRATPRGRALQMLQAVAIRSRKKGFTATITLEWLTNKLEAGRCELTGIPFDFSRAGLKGPYAPSLDRIDAKQGYIEGNCRIILWSLNTAFSWWGEEAFRPIVEAWLNACGDSHDRDVNAARNILIGSRYRASVCGNGFKSEYRLSPSVVHFLPSPH